MFQPKFTITPEINNRIAAIERIREIVKKAAILPQQEVVLRLRAKVDSIHSSTSIEGNRLNKREVEKVLGGQRVRASERMITEALNYKKALDFLEKRLVRIKTIKLSDILKLHSLLMKDLLPGEKAGYFRLGPVFIVDAGQSGDVVRYVGPKAERVTGLLSNLLSWLDKTGAKLHPVLVAGIFHFEFVSIHPFSDGNGRATRLLTQMYLWLKNYDFRKALALDTYYWQNRPAYYQALNQAKTYDLRTGADITPWLEFFTQGFLAVARDLEKEVTAVSLTGGRPVVRLSRDELQIVDFAQQMGRIDLRDVVSILDLPERTAQRRLRGLVDKQILIKHGQGRNVYYMLRSGPRKK